jgi:hypothetical protein
VALLLQLAESLQAATLLPAPEEVLQLQEVAELIGQLRPAQFGVRHQHLLDQGDIGWL